MNRFLAVTAGASLAVAALVSLSAQAQPAQAGAAAAKPRGATAPPEQANAKPVNFLPNPYETVRNFGPLPNGRKWGSVSAVDVSSVAGANRTLGIVDAALQAVNNQRAKFGALQSRFETTIGNLQSTSENLSASRSRIRDTDFASETANMTRSQILQQAGTAMLAQANQLPQGVLSLLR